MDAREQLRRYLEQRRDMGETELVLDRLTVDEALRILGASAGATRSADRRESSSSPAAVERETPVGSSVDWREALRAAGALPVGGGGAGDAMPPKPIKAKTPEGMGTENAAIASAT